MPKGRTHDGAYVLADQAGGSGETLVTWHIEAVNGGPILENLLQDRVAQVDFEGDLSFTMVCGEWLQVFRVVLMVEEQDRHPVNGKSLESEVGDRVGRTTKVRRIGEEPSESVDETELAPGCDRRQSGLLDRLRLGRHSDGGRSDGTGDLSEREGFLESNGLHEDERGA
jgi:hypothetical protein